MEFSPVDLKDLEKRTNNIYEAVIVAAKRARQVNDENRLEYNTILNPLSITTDDDFEEKENPEVLKTSLEFENRPKPHLIATQEILDDKIEYRYKEVDETETSGS